MKALTGRQAVTCETAATKRCRCRCGGALHGAARLTTEAEARELAADDAHCVPVPGELPGQEALELQGEYELEAAQS